MISNVAAAAAVTVSCLFRLMFAGPDICTHWPWPLAARRLIGPARTDSISIGVYVHLPRIFKSSRTSGQILSSFEYAFFFDSDQ